jgi:hypothetical protein
MADIKVRNLDDRITDILKTRAKAARPLPRGGDSADARRLGLLGHGGFARRAAVVRAATAWQENDPSADSVATIREQRDAWD